MLLGSAAEGRGGGAFAVGKDPLEVGELECAGEEGEVDGMSSMERRLVRRSAVSELSFF